MYIFSESFHFGPFFQENDLRKSVKGEFGHRDILKWEKFLIVKRHRFDTITDEGLRLLRDNIMRMADLQSFSLNFSR